MRRTFRVLFYIKRKNPDRRGMVPVMCRITVNGERAQFSVRLSVDPARWDVERGRLAGRDRASLRINGELDDIRFRIEGAYRSMLERENYASASKLREYSLGLQGRRHTLLETMRRHNEEFLVHVGQTRSRSTYNKYKSVFDHLCAYVRTRCNKPDIPLREINRDFINGFELFLRRDMGCCANTVWVYMMPLKRVVAMARAAGHVSSDPFAGYRAGCTHKQRRCLTCEELQTLMAARMRTPAEATVRDLFVFSCFTGLSYVDMRNLEAGNIRRSFDGHLWISTRRKKTDTQLNIRLLDVPAEILANHRADQGTGRLFRVPSNQHCNRVLRCLSERLGLGGGVTFHVARHTFATTITLSNGVPIETVSSLLGHTDIKTTQIYARITSGKVSRDMDRLAEKLHPFRKADQSPATPVN